MSDILLQIEFGRLLLALAIIAGSAILARYLTREGSRLAGRYVRYRHGLMNGSAVLRFLVYIVAAALAGATLFSVSREALIASAGALALTLGLAFQDLAMSLVGGITLLVDRPFQVGDRVQFHEHYGDIVEIGLRAVRLRTLDDSIVSIPNSLFIKEAVSSANAGALDMMVVIPFWLDPNSPVDVAKRIVRESIVTSPYAYLAKPVTVRIEDRLVDVVFTTQVTAKAYVFNTQFEKAFISDVTERAKRAFRANGVACAVQPPMDTRLYRSDRAV